MCHISSRTRTSTSFLSSIDHEVTRRMVTPDLEDVVPSRKRKRTLPRKPIKQTVKKEEEEEEEEPDVDNRIPSRANHPTKKRIGRKSIRTILKIETEECEVEPPRNWAETYSVMKEMRTNGVSQNAAVDSMGCERIACDNASPRERRFHILISLMLSSQTKDTINAATMNRLFNELPPHQEGGKHGLTIENILAVNANFLNQLIWAVGFHNNKTKYIKATAEILRDQWNSDIPDTFQGLVSLPGVGPKMAYLCLSSAWGRTEGIGVDVHVHRITNLWGWHKTKTPEESRVALQAWLPKELWHEINWLLVGLGQTTCLPIGRKCGECDLAKKGLCASANVKPKNNLKVKNGMAYVRSEEDQHQHQHPELNNEFKIEKNQDSPSNTIKIKEEDDL